LKKSPSREEGGAVVFSGKRLGIGQGKKGKGGEFLCEGKFWVGVELIPQKG